MQDPGLYLAISIPFVGTSQHPLNVGVIRDVRSPGFEIFLIGVMGEFVDTVRYFYHLNTPIENVASRSTQSTYPHRSMQNLYN